MVQGCAGILPCNLKVYKGGTGVVLCKAEYCWRSTLQFFA